PTVGPAATGARPPDGLAVGPTRGVTHLDLAGAHLDPAAATRRARVGEDLAAPAARRAHLRERERTLVVGDRPRAAALGTRFGHRARGRTGTRARRARRVGSESHRRRDTADRVLEGQVQLRLEVAA